jgi:hypothetical protein
MGLSYLEKAMKEEDNFQSAQKYLEDLWFDPHWEAIRNTVRDLQLILGRYGGYEKMPRRYRELWSCLEKYYPSRMAEHWARIRNRPDPEANKEKFYNELCNGHRNRTYKAIHSFLSRHVPGFSGALLRKYKQRRIEKTKDYRETVPVSKADLKRVECALRGADYRLSPVELLRASGLDEQTLNFALQKMNSKGQTAYTKERKGGRLREVIVLRTK